MAQGEKDRVSKEGIQKKAKKEYKTPRLIIFGTVTHLTDAKSPGPNDGKNSRTVP